MGGGTFRELLAVLRRGRALFSMTPGGLPVRITSDRHAEKLLRREGVTELLCLPGGHPARTPKSWARGLREAARLEAELNRWRPPANDFVIEPAYRLHPPAEAGGAAGQTLTLPVTVENEGPAWFSSDYVYYPVHLSYRWLDADDLLLLVLIQRSSFQSSKP